jgi:hypothetical protein
MNDKNLREVLAWCEFGHANSIDQSDIDSIKSAILKDQEEERELYERVEENLKNISTK